MNPAVWIGALVAGLCLGMLGTGGSILTLPILIYLVGIQPKVAIACSLAIVAGIAFASALDYARKGEVQWRHVLLFGIPGIGASYAGALASSDVSGAVQLLVFAVVMALSAYSMLSPGAARAHPHSSDSHQVLVASGAGVGLVTGFVGVGGGFLLVPALIMLGGLEMRRAVGTALFIAFLNATSGFYKHIHLLHGRGLSVNWHIIGIFLAVGIVGSLVGHRIAHRIPERRLRKLFGYLLILLCLFVTSHSVPQLL